MDAFEINKIIGWSLAALLVIFGGRTVMEVYNGGHGDSGHDKAAYEIEVSEAGATKADGKKAEKAEVDIKTLLAAANVDSGEKQAKKCKACHSFDKGGKNKVGPALYDILNRKVASSPGFAYSAAMKGMDGAWDYDKLAAFLANPKREVPGTAMAFGGVKNTNKLADLIVFLRTKSDNPAALPKAK